MAIKAETACRDCKRCTNSALADMGRKAGRKTAKWATLGMSELGFAMTKKCKLCGHQMSLHGKTTAPPPTVSVVGLEALASLQAAGVPADEAEVEAEKSKLPADKDQFDVILEAAGSQTIAVVKKVRELQGLGLWQAMALVSSPPKFVLEDADKDTAARAKTELEAVGATVRVK